jgi:alanine dehydrogenase
MRVGILREIKEDEHRVSMTPAGVEVMRQSGHAVLLEKNAGTAKSTSPFFTWQHRQQ